MTEIPDEYTNRYYMMDPMTDDLLSDGSKLLNDMVVLIEGSACRIRIPENGVEEFSEEFRAIADKYHRWCRVSDVALIDNGDTMSFVGTYSDGTKRKFMHRQSDAWFVKLDSIPATKSNNEYFCILNEEESKVVLHILNMTIGHKGLMTVAELKRLLKWPVKDLEEFYGWTDGAEFVMHQRSDGMYELHCPPPMYIIAK